MDKVATYHNGVYRLKFSYNPKLIESLKKHCFGYKWNPNKKYWSIPPIERNLKWMEKKKFSIEGKPEVKKYGLDDLKLKSTLYPYQEEGVQYILNNGLRGIIADEMGLGKTIQAIAISTVPKIKTVTVVCPAAVKYVWANQFREHAGKFVQTLQGNKTSSILGLQNIVVINYDILKSWKDELKKRDLLILDEFHYIKNSKSLRTKAVKEMAKTYKYVVGLSGTPITNRPIEFYNMLNILDKKVFNSYFKFGMQFCAGYNDGWGWNFTGTSNESELKSLVYEVGMIRRRKKEVMKDLPEKQYSIIPIGISERDRMAYRAKHQLIIDRLKKLKNQQKLEGFGMLEELKQQAVKLKMPFVLKWLDDFLEQSEEKIVLFATHRNTVDQVQERYGERCISLDGRTPANQRQNVVETFVNDPQVRIFVGNIRAAGTGIDGLQHAANNVGFLELAYTPAEHQQAEDRVHRIGQDGSVIVYYFVAQDTIEEELANMIDRKRKIFNDVIEVDSDVSELKLIDELIESIRGGKE